MEGESRLIAFVEKSIAYTGVDFLGLDRMFYSPDVRVIPVPTTALLGFNHILEAFAMGADGVLVIEGDHDIDETFSRERMDEYRDNLEDLGIDGMRLYYNLIQLPAYKNIAKIFELYTTTIEDLEPLDQDSLEEIREKIEL